MQSAGLLRIPASFREGLQAIVFFVGQVIINNFDIVLVKHFFPAAEAGLYAAVALVGRVVNMFAWSVVSTMFPISAGNSFADDGGRTLLLTSLSWSLDCFVCGAGTVDVPEFVLESHVRCAVPS